MDVDDEEELDEIGFAKAVIDAIKKSREELRKAGLDVDRMIEELEKTLREAEDLQAQLDELKRQELMEMSKSLIGDKGAAGPSVEKLDMAVKDLLGGETTEEYYKRLKRRGEKPQQDSSYT